MDQRERFEAAYRETYPTVCSMFPGKFERDDLDEYVQGAVEIAWQLFCMAEASALERAAQVCDEYGDLTATEKDSALLVGKVDLSNAMSGEPRAAEFLAKAIRNMAAPVERGGE